jgi:hypothetical protein
MLVGCLLVFLISKHFVPRLSLATKGVYVFHQLLSVPLQT